MSSLHSDRSPDIASLISLIRAGGSQSQMQLTPQQVRESSLLMRPDANFDVGANLPVSVLRQHLHGNTDVLSHLIAQNSSHLESLQRIDLASLLGVIQQGSNETEGRQQSRVNPQGIHTIGTSNHVTPDTNQQGMNHERSLALSRIVNAHLLNGHYTSPTSNEAMRKFARENVHAQTGQVTDSTGSNLASQNRIPSFAGGISGFISGKTLEHGSMVSPCRARGMPVDHNPLVRYQEHFP